MTTPHEQPEEETHYHGQCYEGHPQPSKEGWEKDFDEKWPILYGPLTVGALETNYDVRSEIKSFIQSILKEEVEYVQEMMRKHEIEDLERARKEERPKTIESLIKHFGQGGDVTMEEVIAFLTHDTTNQPTL